MAFTLALTLIVSACTKASSAPAFDIDPNGSLTESLVDTFRVIDPQGASFINEIRAVNLVYEPLLSLDPITLRPAAGAATLTSISADGLTYRFTLLPGLTYSDGLPVKASDYAYGIGRTCDPSINSAYAATVRSIVGCEKWSSLDPAAAPPDQLAAARRDLFANGIVVLGERDLEIRLRDPAPYLSSFLALWLATPVRQSDVDRYGANWWLDPATYIGNGPFTLSEWVIGKRIVFERNARYRRPAKLKRLAILVLQDQREALDAYKSGAIDRLVGVGVDLLPAVTASGLDRELVITSSSCSFYLRLNNARPPLDDPKVRLALAKSIDRVSYGREVRGFATPATSFIPAGLPGHDPVDSTQAYDLAEAKRLLGESRYATSDLLHQLVWTLNATAATNMPTRKREADWIARQWQSLGIDTRIELVDAPTLSATNRVLATRQLIVGGAWCADYPDQADWFSLFFTSSAQKGGADFGYRNSTVDALLGEADRITDLSRREELYLRASRTISADVAWIWLAYAQSASLNKPWVGGLNANAIDSGGIYHPGDVFVRQH